MCWHVLVGDASDVLSVQRPGAGLWVGGVRVIDPTENKTLSLLQLDDNEVPVCITTLQFTAAADGLTYVVVGVVKNLKLETQGTSASFLNTYRMVGSGEGDRRTQLELVHKTEVDGIPGAVQGFNGRLLAGVGKFLRLYDLGKRKLLRKCENKQIPNHVVDIQTMGHRIVVCDARESFMFVRYKAAENRLVLFADDTQPRWLTKCAILDYSTVAGVDKFGNITIVRLPANVTDDIDEDPTGTKSLWDRGLLNGASQKVEIMANYYIGETALSLQRAVLTPGGSECMCACNVGVLVYDARDVYTCNICNLS